MVEAILRHVALPALAPAAIIGLSFTPVLLFGCVNRGLLALAVVLLSAGAAFVTVGIGLREQARGRSSVRWIISTIILTTPLVLVLGPLG
ncbi:MAG TPA: hypothetical protein VK878_26435 [Candidatus Deferrimicrobiaceae bacterium]|nr:hypothetical protein [Candidatus Deferrimicrobiaceae bacterium]